jgi:amino acid transporter
LVDDSQASLGSLATGQAQEALRRNSLNLPRLAFIGLAYFSLAPVIYLNMGFMESDSGGPVMPFLFILITIAVLPTAISFALMNNRRPSAGSGYTWLWESTYPGVGLWLGWVMMATYFVVAALYPPAFELGLPFKTGSSIVWFSLAWAVIGIGWAVWWSRRRQLSSISLASEV